MFDLDNIVNSATGALENAGQAAQQAVQSMGEAASGAAQTMQQGAEEAAQQAQAAAEDAAQQAQQAMSDAAQQAQQAMDEAAQEAQQAVDQATQQAKAAAEEALQEAQAAVEQAAQEAQAAAEQAAQEAQAAAEQAAAQAQEQLQAAQEQAEQVIEDVEAEANEAIQAAQEEVNNAVQAAEEAVNEAAEAAQQAGEDAAAVVEAAAEEAAAAVKAAAEQAAQALEEAAGAIANAVSEAAEGLQSAVEEAAAAVSEALQAVQDAVAEAAQAAEEAVAEAVQTIEDAVSDLLDLGEDSAGPSEDEFISQFFLKINGTKASLELMRDVIEIEVEDNLYLPDMFTIHIHDSAMKWANTFAIGDVIDISARAAKQAWRGMIGTTVLLIQGEVTGLEPDLGSEGGIPTLIVRGYDRAHRLHQGKQTRSFLNSTDHEIVEKLAREVQLKPDTTPTSVIHEHVTQNNQTNMEFLQERARGLGYQLYAEEETLHFHPGNQDEGTGPKLEWGMNLTSFRPNMSPVHQVKEVEVRSWNPMTKQEIVGRANSSQSKPQVQAAGSQPKFKGSDKIVVSRPVKTQQEADALAQAMKDELGGQMLQADGLCLGDPDVKAGKKVEIVGLGDQFDGEYFITVATHTYHADEGYETSFSIGGREPETLTSLLQQKKDDSDPGRGVRVALVTNNKDPENLGRIKVKYPGLDDADESPWVRIAAPMAGGQRGFYYLPEINDEVLIAFEQGDIHRPYMLGALWNGVDKPPKPNSKAVGSDGKVNERIIKSRSGHQIILDDTTGKEKITIATKDDQKIVLDDGQQKVIISDKNGNTITINAANNALSLETQGNLSIKAGQQLSIEAAGKITIKGATIDLN